MNPINPLQRFAMLLGAGLLYYSVVVPLGLLRRLSGADPLRQRRSADSYWEDVSATAEDRRDFDPY